MPHSNTQEAIVIKRLFSAGWINHDFARKRGIKRLPAVIHRLRKAGYNILAISDGKSITYLIGRP